MYAKARDEAWTEFGALLLDIDRAASAEQRARAVARLRGFAEDFAALATSAQPR